MTRPSLLLVFGGMSSEHGVSCLTAASVLGSIDRDRYDITCVGITHRGEWTLVPLAEAAAMKTVDNQLPEVTGDHPEVVLGPGGYLHMLSDEDGRPRLVAKVDVAFALLHGPYGEDGTIQGQFEMAGIRYVGAGVACSAIGMDKALMKTALAGRGIPQVPWCLVTDADWTHRREEALARVNDLVYPLFVKPARAGSSIGITRVTHRDDLEAAIEAAREHDPRVVIEQGIAQAREVECAVLGGRNGQRARASLPGEIRMLTDGWYDFEAKYLPGEQVALDIPATIDEDLLARVQDIAIRTFEAMDAEGLSRIDTFVTQDGDVLVNEINTMPGFTQYSMYPALWEATGLPYGELIDELITLALERPLGLR